MESPSSTFPRSATSWPRRRRRKRKPKPPLRPRVRLRPAAPPLRPPRRVPLRRPPPRAPLPPPRRVPLPPRKKRRRSRTGDNWETPAREGGGFFLLLDPDRRSQPIPLEFAATQRSLAVERIEHLHFRVRDLDYEDAVREMP